MTQNAEDIVKDLTTEGTFDLGAVLSKAVKYPKGKVKVYVDGELAQEVLDAADAIAEKHIRLTELINEQGGTVGESEDVTALEAEIEANTDELQRIAAPLDETALTFHLRGLAPKQWRMIDKVWRQKIRSEKNASDAEKLEDNITRNEKINVEIVSAAIEKVELADGTIHEGHPPFEQIEQMYNTILESEWQKLHEKAQQLTFANSLFDATAQDADFLPQPSLGEPTEDSSSQSE